ncbi:MAG: 4'-phosphopantetheinyl transferase superfamily protein [Spirochaetaceae bacterium]|jgi:phosphopantetheine--protein transferase-like protein|nr:4'-phosphopantetheinyl transferase superfamily protein [Spirochaetaceae bacterium]
MDEMTLGRLKSAIANVVDCRDIDIDDTFPLDSPRFKSSAGSVILANIIKKICKKRVDCNKVKTFGELCDRINDNSADITSENVVKERETTAESEPSLSRSLQDTFQLKCGIDIQDTDVFPETNDYWTEPFYQKHFSGEEIAYCAVAEYPRQHFAGRWCVKEAVIKCGLDVPFDHIQIKRLNNGAIFIEILRDDGDWIRINATCSMSHSEKYAVGMVILYV